MSLNGTNNLQHFYHYIIHKLWRNLSKLVYKIAKQTGFIHRWWRNNWWDVNYNWLFENISKSFNSFLMVWTTQMLITYKQLKFCIFYQNDVKKFMTISKCITSKKIIVYFLPVIIRYRKINLCDPRPLLLLVLSKTVSSLNWSELWSSTTEIFVICSSVT